MLVSVSPALSMELATGLGAQHSIYSTSPKWHTGKGPRLGHSSVFSREDGARLFQGEPRFSPTLTSGLFPFTDKVLVLET